MSNRQGKLSLSIGVSVMLGGCSAFQPQARLEIRSVETAQRISGATDQIAEGRSLLALGQNGNAISAFRSALRDNPNSGDAYNGLAIAYDRIGRQDLAQRYFELAVSADPENMRYRGNLARLFERTGQPKLAFGLMDTPARQKDVTAASDAPTPIANVVAKAPEFVPAMAEAEPTEVGPSASIALPALADLDIEGVVADLPATINPEAGAEPANAQVKRTIVSAVYRPTAAMSIRPAAIETRNLPKPGPQHDPYRPSERQPVDLPRQAAIPMQREGTRLERVSLGEVRLVTRPSTPKLASKSDDFNSFGVRLATWLPGVIAVERQGREARLAESPMLKDAIARAQIEKAIDDVAPNSEEITELQTFTYAFFHDEGVEEVTLAAL